MRSGADRYFSMNAAGMGKGKNGMPIKKETAHRMAIVLLLGFVLTCNISRQDVSLSNPAQTPNAGAAASKSLLESTPTTEPAGANAPTPGGEIFPPTVDEVLVECPTAQEIVEIDSKIKMSFEADPTAGQFVCTAAAGSADLTREQKNAYNAILIMKRLAFDAPLPWTDLPLYDWFTSTIRAIRFRSDIAAHTCCGDPPTINIKAELHAFYSDRWTAVGGLTAIYIHEVRHTYMAHRCGGRDNTIAEMGAYGVEALLYQWLAYHSDSDFLTMLSPGPTSDYREAARYNFYMMQKSSFCADPTPTMLPPTLAAAADAGTPVWTERMIQAYRSGIPVPVPVSPEEDAAVATHGAVFTWKPVDFPGGVAYGIEVDTLFRSGPDWEYWQARTDAAGLSVPSYSMPLPFDGTYTKVGRWRVWAVSPTAGTGPKSDWHYFKIG